MADHSRFTNMDKKPSCSSHKRKTNLEKNTLSETKEGKVGLDLPRDAFLLSCHSPACKEVRKVTYEDLGNQSGIITVTIRGQVNWTEEDLDYSTSQKALENFMRLEVHMVRLEKIITKELVSVRYDMFMKEDGPSSRKWECNGNRMSQLVYLSNPTFFSTMDFKVLMRLLRECFQKLKSRIGLKGLPRKLRCMDPTEENLFLEVVLLPEMFILRGELMDYSREEAESNFMAVSITQEERDDLNREIEDNRVEEQSTESSSELWVNHQSPDISDNSYLRFYEDSEDDDLSCHGVNTEGGHNAKSSVDKVDKEAQCMYRTCINSTQNGQGTAKKETSGKRRKVRIDVKEIGEPPVITMLDDSVDELLKDDSVNELLEYDSVDELLKDDSGDTVDNPVYDVDSTEELNLDDDLGLFSPGSPLNKLDYSTSPEFDPYPLPSNIVPTTPMQTPRTSSPLFQPDLLFGDHRSDRVILDCISPIDHYTLPVLSVNEQGSMEVPQNEPNLEPHPPQEPIVSNVCRQTTKEIRQQNYSPGIDDQNYSLIINVSGELE